MIIAGITSLYERTLARLGSTMTLQRTGVADITFRGYMHDVAEKALVGDLQQGDRTLAMGASEMTAAAWATPVRPGDKVVYLGKTYAIQTVDPIAVDGSVVRYNLVVRG